MTFEELKSSEKEFVVAADIAKIIGIDPYALVLTARETPEKLGFPSLVIGKRVRFPRRAFIKFVEGERA